MTTIRNIELLELIAELKMSDSKARQALGQEVSRLVHDELAALYAVVEALMKATLKVSIVSDVKNLQDDQEVLSVELVVPTFEYSLWKSTPLDDNDKGDYYSKLEDAVNEALSLQLFTKIPFIIDDSVVEFGAYFDDGSDGVSKYINSLVIGM